MKKTLTTLLVTLIILSCSSDEDDNVVSTGISPPEFLQGTWSSIVDDEPIRYTFTSNNIIEEDLFHPVVQLITTNFREEYTLDEYNIEEEFIPFIEEPNQPESYVIRITRRDGAIIDSTVGNGLVRRKFDNVKRVINGEIFDTILLDFGGYNGIFLYKEE